MRFLIALILASGFTTPPGYNTVQNAGTDLTKRLKLNFTGSAVVCVDDAVNFKTTCTITAGAGSTTFIQQQIDFGCGGGASINSCDTVTTTVATAAAALTSLPVCQVDSTTGTADHAAGEEDAVIEAVVVTAANIVNGVSFDIIASAGNGTWGRYMVNCVL